MQDIRGQSYNEWLIIRAQQGERQALHELLSHWSQRYFLYAVNRLQDHEAAKDVTQDCLFSIARSLKKLRDPSAFQKWSFKILERRCVDWLRKTIRDRQVLQSSEKLPEIAVEDKTSETLSAEQLLALLDPRISSILRLFYLEGLSLNEIAEIADLPTGTIKSRLHYGRKLLANALE